MPLFNAAVPTAPTSADGSAAVGRLTAARIAFPDALAALRGWLARRDWTFWLLWGVALLSLVPRLYGLNWDADNHLHPDERAIVFKAICLSLPGTPRPAGCDPAYTGPGWFFSPLSPLNPHFFAYGTLPQYLLAAVAHLLAWLTHVSGGRFAPPDGGTWDDFNHFTLVGRALSALFDAGSVLLAGLIGRRLAGRWVGILAAAFVATIPFDVQVSHYYAVDTLLLFFVLLTLYACIRLVQTPALAQTRDAAGSGREWRAGLFTGAAFGLAMATKVSALPLLAPIIVALLLVGRRRGLRDLLLVGLGIAAAAVIAFVVTSPYALVDSKNFQAQVAEQTQLSQGLLDFPYVRQYAGTTPVLYQLQQLLLYNMGLPLGLLGLAGFGWAVSRLWRTLNNDWLILVSWIAVYFAVIASAYTKFSRYMLPIFAPLAICGAAALIALAAWGTRRLALMASAPASHAADASSVHSRSPRFTLLPHGPFPAREGGWGLGLVRRATAVWGMGWWRAVCAALGVGILAASAFFTLALANVYSTPNTRVQASEWIYDHIQAGKTLTYEIWDDPLPVSAPAARTVGGVGLTAAGHAINPGQYAQVGLDLYAADTTTKAQQLAGQLASADVVVISSQRLLRSIPKLPDRYPMTTRYYQMLFNGQLGFTLAAHFENHPNLFGVSYDDTGADESYSVYDHPPVWIFVRAGAGLPQARLTTLLTNALSAPVTASRPGSQKSLLLSPQNAAADAASPTLDAQLPPDSLPNRVAILWWVLVVELLGLVSFPLAYHVFPGLRDRGWGLSKLLGLLILAYAIWLPSSLRLLPFDRGVVALAFVLLAAAGGLVAWRRRAEMAAFLREHWRLLAVGECVFLAGFLFFVWVRALDPDLWHIFRGGEKPMELAFLNAILRSRYMPPLDPWFAGGAINYYYYGQYLVAVLIKLTGIVPTTAFNLAIPLLFGLTLSGAYSVVAGLTGRWWAGVAGAFGLGVVGNLDGFQQALGQWGAILAHLPAVPFDYWRSSRVIPFTINEFPYWSFLYADLHAHVIDLPIVVLLIACCASLLVALRRDERHRWRAAAPTLAAVALALGAAWCTSTWDVPTYGLLVAVALALALLPIGGGDGGLAALFGVLNWPTLRGFAIALALTFGATYALYLPFHANYQNFVSGTGPVKTPTDPRQFATLFGLWLFLLVSFFFFEWRARASRRHAARPDAATTPPPAWGMNALIWGAVLLVAFFVSLKLLLILLIGIGLYLALDTHHAPARLFTYVLLLLGLAVALGVEFIYVRDFLDHTDFERMNTVFKFYYQVWTLFALGGALAFAHILSHAPSRFAVTAISGEPERGAAASLSMTDMTDMTDAVGGHAMVTPAPLLAPGLARLSSPRGLWLVGLLALVLASSVFLVEGTQVRVQDPAVWALYQPPVAGVQPQGLSLDGMAFMRGWYPGDYAAITWINAHIAGDPTIVEASDANYQWYNRVSVYTGLPDVLGWGSREYEQRYGDEVFPRQADVQGFWATPDPALAASFLHRYGVKYVYLGTMERTCYIMPSNQCVPLPRAALEKFTALERAGTLRSVYTNADVTIYEVSG
ncbi:MAG TPA: DUF2298 domain-containing protein [Ktedonobacterales bacterium]|nr:DUF2298 domain-containing protein [Ktedonobacterales bacterium]